MRNLLTDVAGLSVGNALAYGLSAPIIGSREDKWEETGIAKLLSGKNDQIRLVRYG